MFLTVLGWYFSINTLLAGIAFVEALVRVYIFEEYESKIFMTSILRITLGIALIISIYRLHNPVYAGLGKEIKNKNAVKKLDYKEAKKEFKRIVKELKKGEKEVWIQEKSGELLSMLEDSGLKYKVKEYLYYAYVD